MNNSKMVSSKEITRSYGIGHGDILTNVRTLMQQGIIKSVTMTRYQADQNKQFYDIFLFPKSEVPWLVAKLKTMPIKYPVRAITKDMKEYVLDMFHHKCFNCDATENLDIHKMEHDGLICSSNLYVTCDDCFGGVI